MRKLIAFAAAVTAAMAATQAWAHVPDAAPAATLTLSWTWTPWVVCALLLSLFFYSAGLLRMWLRAGFARGVRPVHVASFMAGWLALAAALVSPLDALGAQLFSAHMLQHEIMMVVAAPLLVIGRPLAVWTWALPPPGRRRAGRIAQSSLVAAPWSFLTAPLVAWALHGIVLWGWHVPAFFEAALASDGWHTVQHLSFFLSALLFWWAPLGSHSRTGHGVSMLYLFTTMVHTGALGALLTLSPTIWYPAYGDAAMALGIDPLEDQQLGGLVMWVPAGMAYLIAGLAAAAAALRGARPRRGTVPLGRSIL